MDSIDKYNFWIVFKTDLQIFDVKSKTGNIYLVGVFVFFIV